MRLFCYGIVANFAAKGGFVTVRLYSFAATFSAVADFVAGKHAVNVAP